MTKRTQVHRKLLLEHKKLSDKYKLLQAKLSTIGNTPPTDIALVLHPLDLIFFSFSDMNSQVGVQS